MKTRICLVASVSLAMGGCGMPLSPPQLVGEPSSEVAVKEFLYAGSVLADVYGFTLTREYVAPRPVRANADVFGLATPQSIPYRFELMPNGNASPFIHDRYSARDYFIRSGYYASLMVCRNYLSGLRDRNEYFEFLQKEFQVAANLTSLLLTITNVAEKSKDIFTQVVGAANLSADAYQTFRFLAPEIETILPIVEAAQVALRDYYLSDKGKPATFAGALNAVSKIEYQCSRSGIRSLLNKTLVQSKPQFEVSNGILYANRAEDSKKSDQKNPSEKPAGKKSPDGK